MADIAAGKTVFNGTGAAQEFTVPSNGSIAFKLWGAGGSGALGGVVSMFGGFGGFTTGEINVAAGDVIKIEVGLGGGAPGPGMLGGLGGFPDGGDGSGATTLIAGGAGGGSSRIWKNGALVAIAGAGGGTGRSTSTAGNGGGLAGTNGGGAGAQLGTGGTQTAGGIYGSTNAVPEMNGGYLQGAHARLTTGSRTDGGSANARGAGGGGGYYGGAAGGLINTTSGGGGGGGSGWFDRALVNAGQTTGYNNTDSDYIAGRALGGGGGTAPNAGTDGIVVTTYTAGKVAGTLLPANGSTTASYIGSDQSYIATAAGDYVIHAWGAGGGGSSLGAAPSGQGGYVTGRITLAVSDIIRVQVGQAGQQPTTTLNGGAGGWPDGGDGTNDSTNPGRNYPGGGGSTRVYKNDVLVAVVGGGGATSRYATPGGNGGGLIGGDGGFTSSTAAGRAYGGTQTAGGAGGVNAQAGAAMQGGHAYAAGGNINSRQNPAGSGGGGGWYGGGGASGTYSNTATFGGGGGGSSRVIGLTDAQNVQGYGTSLKRPSGVAVGGGNSATGGSPEAGNGAVIIENYAPPKTLGADTTATYTGAFDEWVVAADGKVEFEAWGAGGGGGSYTSPNPSAPVTTKSGGFGGYLKASFPVAAGDKIQVEVGQGGRKPTGYSPVVGGGLGGFPDGGAAGTSTTAGIGMAGGGGSSRIYKNGILMGIAGGGGGATGFYYGGSGGGGTGSGAGNSLSAQPLAEGANGVGGAGGTQIAAGANAGALRGADSTGLTTAVATASAGGGGGWYGGGTVNTTAGNHNAGGGGSSNAHRDTISPDYRIALNGVTSSAVTVPVAARAPANTGRGGLNGTTLAATQDGFDGAIRMAFTPAAVTLSTTDGPKVLTAQGRDQTITATQAGVLRLKMWGAGGGGGTYNSASTVIAKRGGAGAYNEVFIKVAANDVITVKVGVGGQRAYADATIIRGGLGGWPDGGWGARSSSNTVIAFGGGGGSTQVFKNGTLLAVAGAGGGATGFYSGGAGGGVAGLTSADTAGAAAHGLGGTQSAGGLAGGAALQGGNSQASPETSNALAGSGGGGGYYGGGAARGGSGSHGAGGGGSSYANPTGTLASTVVDGNNTTGVPGALADRPAGVGEGGQTTTATRYETVTNGGDGAVHATLLPLMAQGDPIVPGQDQAFIAPDDLIFTAHMWGGGGGSGTLFDVAAGGGPHGGGAGYTTVTFRVAKDDFLLFQVAKGGKKAVPNTAPLGGWPDGGQAGNAGTTYQPGGGGGSTRIWRNGVLMAVAAGGGGSGGSNSNGKPGSAGGLTGQDAAASTGRGLGGTQSAGGVNFTSPSEVNYQGGYLRGGRGSSLADPATSTVTNGGGGGGGYYGGAGGGGPSNQQPGGGGGSSYLNTSALGYRAGSMLAGSTAAAPANGDAGGMGLAQYPGGTVGMGGRSVQAPASNNTDGGDGHIAYSIVPDGPIALPVPGFTEAKFEGKEQIYNVVTTGTLQVKMWGAGGGGGQTTNNFTDARSAGAGGYTTVNLPVVAGDVLKVQVGQGGQRSETNALGGLGGYPDGGWGGGGYDAGYAGGGGGGSTRLYKNNVLVAVAGAGGGACGNIGGAGGGLVGATAGGGNGGTQTAGGVNTINAAYSGSYLQGGNSFARERYLGDQSHRYAAGGGGGGYYGGGSYSGAAGSYGGGGGGSGYIAAGLTGTTTGGIQGALNSTPAVTADAPAGTAAGGATGRSAQTGNANGGDGYVRIAYFESLTLNTPKTTAYSGSGKAYLATTSGKLAFKLWGAGGGGGTMFGGFGTGSCRAGSGGLLTGAIFVSTGDVITVEVGEGGKYSNVALGRGGYGGYPDGGDGGWNATNPGACFGGGGGSTRLYVNGVLKAVAGSGGGIGWGQPNAGQGGGLTGGTEGSAAAGLGGTQSAGGDFGGSALNGGDARATRELTGGGGGGGYYGGGSSRGLYGPGGGGSSWTALDVVDVVHTQGADGLAATDADRPAGIADGGLAWAFNGPNNPTDGGNGAARLTVVPNTLTLNTTTTAPAMGKPLEYTVAAAGVLSVNLWGGGGAGSSDPSARACYGGAGGWVHFSFPVAANDVIKVEVGQGGRAGLTAGVVPDAAYPDGGQGSYWSAGFNMGGGGGSTRVYKNNVLQGVAAGGGAGTINQNGGSGGFPAGGNAIYGGATGGTQTAGGTTGSARIAAGKFQGGASNSEGAGGGGGGGGWYGGANGSGDNAARGGAGGSSYVGPTIVLELNIDAAEAPIVTSGPTVRPQPGGTKPATTTGQGGYSGRLQGQQEHGGDGAAVLSLAPPPPPKQITTTAPVTATYRGTSDEYTVASAGELSVNMWGGGGGGSNDLGSGRGCFGGAGGWVHFVVPVFANDVVRVEVGRGGQTTATSAYPDGGEGSVWGNGYVGAGGGGSTRLYVNNVLQAVAGGGGAGTILNNGGSGGFPAGGSALYGGSTGGTQTTPGVTPHAAMRIAPAAFRGGASPNDASAGGGGGGGWYGGASGTNTSQFAGGAGGSSYLLSGLTTGEHYAEAPVLSGSATVRPQPGGSVFKPVATIGQGGTSGVPDGSQTAGGNGAIHMSLAAAAPAITMTTNDVQVAPTVALKSQSYEITQKGALDVRMWGAGGGGGITHSSLVQANDRAGGGGFAKGLIPVNVGDIVTVTVGRGGKKGQPLAANTGGAGGYPDGGGTGTGTYNGAYSPGGGGGSSRVYVNGVLKMVAGAGGGGARGFSGGGGGTTGGNAGPGYNTAVGATGGTQTAGGINGGGPFQGATSTGAEYNAGGGGGYYGGGVVNGGNPSLNAGGGGSGYIAEGILGNVNEAAPSSYAGTAAGNTDPHYVAGIGLGGRTNRDNDGSNTDGGDGRVRLELKPESALSAFYVQVPATGADQIFNVTQSGIATFNLWGAGGGGSVLFDAVNYIPHGGGGGFTKVKMVVMAGDVIKFQVGTGGKKGALGVSNDGGWPDGGKSGVVASAPGNTVAGGGGSTRLWLNDVLIAVAGAGGGSGGSGSHGQPGAGGGASGTNGGPTFGYGTGGSQTTGGINSSYPTNVNYQGGYLRGGNGSPVTDFTTGRDDTGAGGGGGYYGGGGGGYSVRYMSGGGGGSGYVNLAHERVIEGTTAAGLRDVPGGTADAEYPGSIGYGGRSSTTAGAGVTDGTSGRINYLNVPSLIAVLDQTINLSAPAGGPDDPVLRGYRGSGQPVLYTVTTAGNLIAGLWGAGGAGGYPTNVPASVAGGGAGFTYIEYPVVPGDIVKLEVGVGGGSALAAGGGLGGWPDGGDGGRYEGKTGGGGGGSTRLWVNSTLVAVAAGAGGAFPGNTLAALMSAGGFGGGLTGGATSGLNAGPVLGATQTQGGVNPARSGQNGATLNGGDARGATVTSESIEAGGGGGGGYYGGAGGGARTNSNSNYSAVGGSGGSSFIHPNAHYGFTKAGAGREPGGLDHPLRVANTGRGSLGGTPAEGASLAGEDGYGVFGVSISSTGIATGTAFDNSIVFTNDIKIDTVGKGDIGTLVWFAELGGTGTLEAVVNIPFVDYELEFSPDSATVAAGVEVTPAIPGPIALTTPLGAGAAPYEAIADLEPLVLTIERVTGYAEDGLIVSPVDTLPEITLYAPEGMAGQVGTAAYATGVLDSVIDLGDTNAPVAKLNLGASLNPFRTPISISLTPPVGKPSTPDMTTDGKPFDNDLVFTQAPTAIAEDGVVAPADLSGFIYTTLETDPGAVNDAKAEGNARAIGENGFEGYVLDGNGVPYYTTALGLIRQTAPTGKPGAGATIDFTEVVRIVMRAPAVTAKQAADILASIIPAMINLSSPRGIGGPPNFALAVGDMDNAVLTLNEPHAYADDSAKGKIHLLRTNVPGRAPATLGAREIAINEADGIIYSRDAAGKVWPTPIYAIQTGGEMPGGGALGQFLRGDGTWGAIIPNFDTAIRVPTPITRVILAEKNQQPIAASIAPDEVRYQPFFVSHRTVLTQVGVNVLVLGDAMLQMGICTWVDGAPGTLLSAAMVSTNTAGLKSIPGTLALEPGWYASVVSLNGTGTPVFSAAKVSKTLMPNFTLAGDLIAPLGDLTALTAPTQRSADALAFMSGQVLA